MTGRSAAPTGFDGIEATNLSRFHRIAALEGVLVTSVVAGASAAHFAAIDVDGNLWVWGRNERGQLGTGDATNIYNPIKAKGVSDAVCAAVGRSHTLVATRDGSIFGAGDGKSGQLGLGKASPAPATSWTKARSFLPPGRTVVALACGGDFSLALDSAGSVWSCGSEEFGQCGTGRTGERIVSAGRLGYDTLEAFTVVAALAGEKVVAIAAGTNHGVALTDEGQVYTWGCGGYGRLGHGSATEELSPKRVKTFEPERMRIHGVSAGATCSYFVTRLGSMMYMSGEGSVRQSTHRRPVQNDPALANRNYEEEWRGQHVS